MCFHIKWVVASSFWQGNEHASSVTSEVQNFARCFFCTAIWNFAVPKKWLLGEYEGTFYLRYQRKQTRRLPLYLILLIFGIPRAMLIQLFDDLQVMKISYKGWAKRLFTPYMPFTMKPFLFHLILWIFCLLQAVQAISRYVSHQIECHFNFIKLYPR